MYFLKHHGEDLFFALPCNNIYIPSQYVVCYLTIPFILPCSTQEACFSVMLALALSPLIDVQFVVCLWGQASQH